MAELFLDRLPQVDLGELPDESKCMICLAVYYTETEEDGTMEIAVRLPCGHDVGDECIRIWLSPDKEGRNSCPACRMTFFPGQPRPYMEHEMFEEEREDDDEREDEHEGEDEFEREDEHEREDEDEGEDEYESEDEHQSEEEHQSEDELESEDEDEQGDLYCDNRTFFSNALLIIGEDGQPPQEVQEVQEVSRRELHARAKIRWIWPEFFGRTAEQYQESIRRAREAITTPRALYPGESLHTGSPYPYLPPGYSEPIHPEDLDPQELEKVIQALATALRTLPFREALEYWFIRDLGPSSPLQDYLNPLTAEQEEMLFQDMERAGAFTGTDSARRFAGLTNRERWQAHREVGETWNPVAEIWSPEWSIGEGDTSVVDEGQNSVTNQEEISAMMEL